MDDLTVTELFAGLTNPSFQSQRTLLLQYIANKFAESNPEDIELDKFIRYFILDIQQQLVSNRTKPGLSLATSNISYTLLILQNVTSYESNCKTMLNMRLSNAKGPDYDEKAADWDVFWCDDDLAVERLYKMKPY